MKVAVGNNKMLQQFCKLFIAGLVQNIANAVARVCIIIDKYIYNLFYHTLVYMNCASYDSRYSIDGLKTKSRPFKPLTLICC